MRKQQLFVVVAGPQTTIDDAARSHARSGVAAEATAQADAALREQARSRAERAEIRACAAWPRSTTSNRTNNSKHHNSG
ncbi:hypothetical protein LP419_06510 [Massilia sp. H-1]|nr:hypothetical protein LP419_06510 [Massilia sp. H-1]